MYDFIITKGSKKVLDLIKTTLELQNASSDLHHLQKSRLENSTKCLKRECVEGCTDEWYQSAKETHGESNIAVETFSHSLKTFLNKGRGKFCTVSIIGPANYEKTVILKSLTLLYKTYINPVTLTFDWSLIAEVTFLNDF